VDKRFKLWLAISLGVFLINGWVVALLSPPKPQPVAQKAADKQDAKKADEKSTEPLIGKPDEPQSEPPTEAAKEAEEPKEDEPASEKPAPKTDAPEPEPQRLTLGSADPASPYRMLVTLTNVGAAIERVELNSHRYHELDDRSGYLGNLALTDVPNGAGALVQVVGEGTPAHAAGVKLGDVIKSLDDKPVANSTAVEEFLGKAKPNSVVKLAIERDGEQQTLTATLRRRPLEVVRPEFASKAIDVIAAKKHDPLSMLLTLQAIDGKSIEAPADGGLGKELNGLKLWTSAWEVEQQADQVTFSKSLPEYELKITKTYKLAVGKANPTADEPLYNLDLEVKIENTGSAAHTVSYQLDGPTGVVLEGAWYASKVSRNWGAAGLRDIVVRFRNGPATEVGCGTIAANKSTPWTEAPLDYIAVDAQYFSAALIPQKKIAEDVWFSDIRPLRVGEVPKESSDHKLTDVSFRLTSRPQVLEKSGSELVHKYQLFAGPKRPRILEQYHAMPENPAAPVTLDDLVYYGWFGWVAKPMLAVLHAFYYVVHNYGIAIVMLTVLVRGAMFPVSRKQALSAQKMQELQPKIKELTEKYKSNPQERQKAQMELFRKHNYNPLAGCLPMFIQLPIFVGLYRSLMVDVELRQAPLISEAVRWCSNLAAPDMLFDWSRWMPEFVNQGQGFFGLGPYFNILPIVTIVLFLWQQKMFMPPPTDDQTAMQQKMMQYMMVFMGFMFFKVASGLCLYFIASSLWGIAERKLLPKPKVAANQATGRGGNELSASTNGSSGSNRKKQQR
jgi:YidC/Oxa1 family membrane protein insertase